MSPQGKRLTMICASLVLLQIMFAVHRFAQGAEGKVLKMDRPLAAGGFLSLTGLWPEGCGIALLGDEFYNAAWRAAYSHFRKGQMTKALPPSPSFRPKRSGVEKSPPLMVRAALRQEIFRLRVSSERFASTPHTGTSPARDDDAGGHHWTHLRCEGL